MRSHRFTLRSGNKAVVFSIDVLIGIMILVISMAFIRSSYMGKEAGSLHELNTARLGSDSVAVFDKMLYFEEDDDFLEQKISEILPRHDIRIDIICSSGRNSTLGGIIPEDKKLYAGKRFIVDGKESVQDICMVRYWIWLR